MTNSSERILDMTYLKVFVTCLGLVRVYVMHDFVSRKVKGETKVNDYKQFNYTALRYGDA